MSVNAWYDTENGDPAMPWVKGKFSSLDTRGLKLDGDAGSNGQFLGISGGDPTWLNIGGGDIGAGANGSLMCTDLNGNAGWKTAAAVGSLVFSGGGYQVALDKHYYASGFGATVTYEDTTTAAVSLILERIGNMAIVKVPTMSITLAAPATDDFRVIKTLPVEFRPAYGVNASNYLDCHSEAIGCRQDTTYGNGTGFIMANGTIVIFTSSDRTTPGSGLLANCPHTFTYEVA